MEIGFSQGGTMMFRWLHHSVIELDYLINYSGWIPEEIDLKESKTDLNAIKKMFIYGLEDQFIKAESQRRIQAVIDSNNLDIKIEPYEGMHRIEKKQLQFLFEKYIQSD